MTCLQDNWILFYAFTWLQVCCWNSNAFFSLVTIFFSSINPLWIFRSSFYFFLIISFLLFDHFFISFIVYLCLSSSLKIFKISILHFLLGNLSISFLGLWKYFVSFIGPCFSVSLCALWSLLRFEHLRETTASPLHNLARTWEKLHLSVWLEILRDLKPFWECGFSDLVCAISKLKS